MSLARFAQIADGLPVDMLFVLRTMHLVKDLHRALGGDNRDRFLAYARAAAASPEPVPPRSFTAAWRVFKFNLMFGLRERVIDWTRWIYSTFFPTSWKGGEESDQNSRFSFSQLIGERMEQALHKKKKPFLERFRRKKKQGESQVEDSTIVAGEGVPTNAHAKM